jgi:hypothetical protein
VTSHWQQWHAPYEDPTSSLSRRLAVVQRQIARTLDEAPPGRIEIFSVCAGQGRDLIDVLATHPRGDDAHALLVELDEGNVRWARERATQLSVPCEIVQADAAESALYTNFRPAWLAVVCGVFGNISDDDIQATIGAMATMVRAGGSVVWTRHRLEPNLVPSIRQWFHDSGFEEAEYEDVVDSSAAVGRHRLVNPTVNAVPEQLFEFFGDGSGAI